MFLYLCQDITFMLLYLCQDSEKSMKSVRGAGEVPIESLNFQTDTQNTWRGFSWDKIIKYLISFYFLNIFFHILLK